MTEREALYTCEQCGAAIQLGDRASVDNDGVALCETHSPMLSEVIASWIDDLDSESPYWPEVFDYPSDIHAHVRKLEQDLAENGDRRMTRVI